MTQDQAVDILETMAELYPKFELSRKKAQILLPQLRKMDYQGVLDKLSAYVADHPYAPTIAEIAVYLPEENGQLQLMKEWQAEAEKVTEETKSRFRLQMHKLLGELVSYEQS